MCFIPSFSPKTIYNLPNFAFITESKHPASLRAELKNEINVTQVDAIQPTLFYRIHMEWHHTLIESVYLT